MKLLVPLLCTAALMVVGPFCAKAGEEEVKRLRELLPKTEPARHLSPREFPERADLMATVKSFGSKSTDILSEILLNNDEDPEARSGAAWVLGEMNDKKAIPALVKALGEPALAVAEAAGYAIGRIDAPEVVPDLVSQYLAGNGEANAVAGAALGHLQRPTYVPALVPLLKHKETKVRARAVEGLGSIGDTSATPHLIAALDDENEGVVMLAAQSLGQIGDASALDALAMRLAKRQAEESDGSLGEMVLRTYLRRAIEAIQKKRGESWAREQKIPDGPAGLPVLIKALKDKEASTRQSAAVELKKRGGEAAPAAGALADLLGDAEERVRVEALGALVAIGAAAIQPAVQQLQNGSPAAREKACAALLRLFAEGEAPVAVDADTIKAISSMLDHPDPNFRANMMMLLGLLEQRAAPAAGALAAKLGDTGGMVAAIALAGIGEEAIPELVRALGAKDRQVRWLAAFALGQVGVRSKTVFTLTISGAGGLGRVEEMDMFRHRKSAVSAVPALVKALGDEEPTVGATAAQALGRMGAQAKAAVPALESTAKAGDPVVQAAAIEALKRIQTVDPREESLPNDRRTPHKARDDAGASKS